MDKGKIMHLTSAHPAFDVRIFHKECRTLVQAGYRVSLIAPGDEQGEFSGVRLINIPKAKGRLRRFSHTLVQVLVMAIRERAALYHFHDSDLIPVGLVLRLLGKRVIYDVHEDVPKDILSKTWIAPSLKTFLALVSGAIEKLAAYTLSALVVTTPSIARRFPAHKTTLVQNLPILGELAPATLPYQERPPWLIYAGKIARNRGILEMLASLQAMANPEVKLVLAGSLDPENLLKELTPHLAWSKVEFLGLQPHAELMERMQQARIGLVVLHPTASFVEALPIKLFEYMAAGIPVVASDFPLWREIVADSRCGLLVDPQNPRELATAIEWLLSHPQEAQAMGEHGKEAVLGRYNWNSEAEKLLDLYRQLLS